MQVLFSVRSSLPPSSLLALFFPLYILAVGIEQEGIDEPRHNIYVLVFQASISGVSLADNISCICSISHAAGE